MIPDLINFTVANIGIWDEDNQLIEMIPNSNNEILRLEYEVDEDG